MHLCNTLDMFFGYNDAMKRITLILPIAFLFLAGCTQVVTAPIYVAGAAVTTTIDVAGATVDAVSDDDEDEEN